jgi:hypothetical protein
MFQNAEVPLADLSFGVVVSSRERLPLLAALP